MVAKRTNRMWVGVLVLLLMGGVVPAVRGEELPLPYADYVVNRAGPALEIGNAEKPWVVVPPIAPDWPPWLVRESYGIEGWYSRSWFVFSVDPNVISPTLPRNIVVDPNGSAWAPGYMSKSYRNTGRLGGEDFGVEGIAEKGVGVYAKGGPGDYAVKCDGDVLVKGCVYLQSGGAITKLGCGFDYAEGFDVSGDHHIAPGTVLVIDPLAPGQLAVSRTPYDTKVAGIAAGAKGLSSGVRLGVGQFDCDVALAGRVYCNVDATKAAVKPGDLLTTATQPGYAMKVTDSGRAQGAILGKAMEGLEKGKKAQILVLVTLQ